MPVKRIITITIDDTTLGTLDEFMLYAGFKTRSGAIRFLINYADPFEGRILKETITDEIRRTYNDHPSKKYHPATTPADQEREAAGIGSMNGLSDDPDSPYPFLEEKDFPKEKP